MLDLTKFTTEQRNQRSMDLDTMTSLQIVTTMNDEDLRAVQSVTKVLPQVATAIDWAAEALERGGRVFYMGAGTSGRLGVLDASECPPTFGVSPDLVVGLIAGGETAFVKAVEGAEDSEELGASDLRERGLSDKDLVVGLAASGRTPYVVGGLVYAKATGCKTIAIACNQGSKIGESADLAIEPVPGPEVLTGSTRLKAGTVQKLILNMISTGAGQDRQGVPKPDGRCAADEREVGGARPEHRDGSDRLHARARCSGACGCRRPRKNRYCLGAVGLRCRAGRGSS